MNLLWTVGSIITSQWLSFVTSICSAHEKSVSLGMRQVSPTSGSLPDSIQCRWACKELPGHARCAHTPLLAHLLANPGTNKEPGPWHVGRGRMAEPSGGRQLTAWLAHQEATGPTLWA